MEPKPTRNHVIFLGAGASYTSGYPVGDALRLRLSSRERFQSEMRKAGGDAGGVEALCTKHFEAFGNSMDLFRNGGFATVDEFSKLLSDTHPQQVQEMKKLMRLAFFFHNPEDNFHESDYYPFIQKLFREDDLRTLKSNITIFSYNYDCYLDFLLLRAYKHRQSFDEAQPVAKTMENRLTSGFFDPTSTQWAEQTLSFNYFKLHGSIAYAGDQDYSWHNFFYASPQQRLERLADAYYKVSTPPVVFPWELFDASGNFISENNFIFVTQADNKQEQERGKALFNLYKKIWEGAKDAVERCHKVSFVGLSMHPFLNKGLAYLFKGKRGPLEVVVANPENRPFSDSKNRLHPASLCGRTAKVLDRIAPTVKYIKSWSEDDGTVDFEDFQKEAEPDITPRYSFREFIEREMN